MSRHETYHQLRIVPCPCGSHEPYWHGPEDGERVYCCDACWRRTYAPDHARPHLDALNRIHHIQCCSLLHRPHHARMAAGVEAARAAAEDALQGEQ